MSTHCDVPVLELIFLQITFHFVSNAIAFNRVGLNAEKNYFSIDAINDDLKSSFVFSVFPL